MCLLARDGLVIFEIEAALGADEGLTKVFEATVDAVRAAACEFPI